MTVAETVIVLAKEPRAGRVKTRLTPPLTPEQSALLAAAALTDTCDAVAASRAARRLLVYDGTPGPWVPPGFDLVAQPAGGLDVRLAAAFAAASGPAVLVGMDTPQITAAVLDDALTALDADDVAVLGPAVDGGFWLVGLARSEPDAFRGVPMSSERTGAVQLARLESLGLRVRLAGWLRDVDRLPDAVAVAHEAPHTRFAATMAGLHVAAVPVG